MPKPWSKNEVEIIVMEYFMMLRKELEGITYSKAITRRALLPKLNDRSEGSIEFKHQNISAVLIKCGCPYIFGYKPRHNYQTLLEDIVLSFLSNRDDLFELFENFANKNASIKENLIYPDLMVEAPQNDLPKDDNAKYSTTDIRKPNYLQLEQQNTLLGQKGEELILSYEKWRLLNAGEEKLAETIEWVSREQGDGMGFDILSKNLNGKDRFIEVKTTKLGDRVPIYFSKNEFTFSQNFSSNFYLYRIFNFYSDPRFFIKQGSFDSFCKVEPTNFIGRF